MTNMIVYLIGTLLVVAGLVVIGLGLMGGIVKTRQKDPAP
jgi:hypothetical protein